MKGGYSENVICKQIILSTCSCTQLMGKYVLWIFLRVRSHLFVFCTERENEKVSRIRRKKCWHTEYLLGSSEDMTSLASTVKSTHPQDLIHVNEIKQFLIYNKNRLKKIFSSKDYPAKVVKLCTTRTYLW